MKGTARTAIGSSSGRKTGKLAEDGMLPCWVRLITDAASIRPMSIEPESPMKMRAGLKLCGRKPRHAPASTTAINVGAVIRS